jgi:hypothetical protein
MIRAVIVGCLLAVHCNSFADTFEDDEAVVLLQAKASLLKERTVSNHSKENGVMGDHEMHNSTVLGERAVSNKSKVNASALDGALLAKGPPPPAPPPPSPSCSNPPTPSPPAPTTTTTTGGAPSKVDLSKVSQSNLGGFGPDSGVAEVRYASAVGSNVDLVVTSGRSSGFEQQLNGVKNGEFGRLSQASGGSYEYTFEFRNGANLVEVDNFVITFFDVDANVRQEIKESITVCGAKEILLTYNTHLSSESEGDCTTVAPAMIDASDNVKRIADLTQGQKDHGFAAVFTWTSRFTVRTTITESKKKVENRALVFSGTPIEGFAPQSLQREKPPPKPCNQVPVDAFAGKRFEVTQVSTLHGGDTYTYVIEIGGSIWQHTGGGSYLVGRHHSYCGGPQWEYFLDGDRAHCGGIPRSATVTYNFGRDMRLLSANEPSGCRYAFTIQLPQTDCAVVG